MKMVIMREPKVLDLTYPSATPGVDVPGSVSTDFPSENRDSVVVVKAVEICLLNYFFENNYTPVLINIVSTRFYPVDVVVVHTVCCATNTGPADTGLTRIYFI